MEPYPVPPLTPPTGPPTGPPRRLPPAPAVAGVVLVVIAAVLVIGAARILSDATGSSASPASSGDASASVIALASAGASLEPSSAASGGLPASTTVPGGPFASSGAMTIVGNDGSLSLVDASGRSIGLSAPDTMIWFPAWSPDGTRIAAIRTGTEKAILVFDATAAASGQPVEPIVIFRSATLGAFYLSWTPDGRNVSFLAEETDGLSLRVAPADGSAPLDGSGPGTKIRSGNPFYFDWIGSDRLFAHIGTGLNAFLGEIGTNGASASPALIAPGDFRSPVVSNDERFISYVRGVAAGSAEVVLARRDGSNEHTMPVFGTAAVVFDPIGDTVASIGLSQPGPSPFSIPIGPVRLIDPSSGKVRTLVDGRVVSFWWSPDGKTIAALRIQPAPGGSSAVSVTSSASPPPSPSQAPTEIRLLFVDVASGEIQSQRVVQPGRLFIDQFLTYFDQYALSHRVWAPDSSSLLLPVTDKAGTTRVAVVYRNGEAPAAIDGAIGFWSP